MKTLMIAQLFTVTNISLVIIIFVFGYFIFQAYKMHSLYHMLVKINHSENVLDSLSSSILSNIKDNYIGLINIPTSSGMRTNIPASQYFSVFNVCRTKSLNMRLLDTASGTLVGLGLLGTFLGLTLGISGVDSSNTENIQSSIQSLLDGMGTAFYTSLLGMLCSLFYTLADKYWRNQLLRNLFDLTEGLDKKYYIDDVTLSSLNNEKILCAVKQEMVELITSKIQTINDNLIYSKENGEKSTVGNAIREILKENSEQTAALKSFSTDLAIQLNDGFDETLSRQMQAKILPLMENVDRTTQTIVEHIDNMASMVSSPATDIIQNMVDELKSSMREIIAEFNRSLSGSATSELENLAIQLSSAGQAMADFPSTMATISSTLQMTIEEVKSAVAEISNTSASTNSMAMQQMQEQISFATGAISNAINEVKEVMNGVSHNSQQQSIEMVSNISDAAKRMGAFLNNTVAHLSTSVQDSITNITNDMSAKQADLISLQEETTVNTRKLLETFTQSLERLEKMNDYISGTMNMFQQAQGHISGSTAHLQVISGNMKTASELFNRSQADYNAKMEMAQTKNQAGLETVTNLLDHAGAMSEDYVEQFKIIKEGISNIFSSIQLGLRQYSQTVQDSTQKYLDQYTSSLTSTTAALSSTIEHQNEVAEMILEALNKNKK